MTPTELHLLQQDIDTARRIIRQALDQYIKRQIGARNKKQAADLEGLFAELQPFSERDEIIEVYGWGDINESEMNRLLTMWDARETARKNAGKYTDRVTEMLETTIRRVGSEYDEQIYMTEKEN